MHYAYAFTKVNNLADAVCVCACMHLYDINVLFFIEQTMHHLSFNNYYSLHCNEAASPLNGVSESQNHPRDRSSWEDSTREFPASGHSSKSSFVCRC